MICTKFIEVRLHFVVREVELRKNCLVFSKNANEFCTPPPPTRLEISFVPSSLQSHPFLLSVDYFSSASAAL